MENASKALLISGGILIAMLVISIGVYLFSNYRTIGMSYEENINATEINKFNVNFTKFEGRKDISIQEIVTLANFAKQYTEETSTNIKVRALGKDLTKTDNLIEIVKENIDKKFKCENIQENDYYADGSERGKIKEIRFNIVT